MAALANPNQKCITLTGDLIAKIDALAASEHSTFAAVMRKITYYYFDHNKDVKNVCTDNSKPKLPG